MHCTKARPCGSRYRRYRPICCRTPDLAPLEAVYPVRLQAVLLPYAMHGCRRQANFFSQASRSPVGSRPRLAQGGAHQCLFLCVGDPPWTPSARPVASTVQATTCLPPPPQTNSSLRNPQPFRQRADTLALSPVQYYPRPGRQRVCDTLASQHASNCARSASLISTTHLSAPMQHTRILPYTLFSNTTLEKEMPQTV
jgi:hypothetical protein